MRISDWSSDVCSSDLSDKPRILGAVRQLADWGWQVIATGGTADYLAGEGIAVERVNKVAEGRPHIVDRIKDGDVQLIFNTTEGWQSLQDSQSIRASALAGDIAYYTTRSEEHTSELQSLMRISSAVFCLKK